MEDPCIELVTGGRMFMVVASGQELELISYETCNL